MLQVYSESIRHRGVTRPGNSSLRWVQIEDKELLAALPFWDAEKIQRIQKSLQTLGVVTVEAGTKPECRWVALTVQHRG